MLSDQRHLFAVPSDVAYFNSAYFGPRLRSVTDAGRAAIDLTGAPWTVQASVFFDPVEQLRSTVGALFGDDSEGVALVSSVSYGIAVAAVNLTIGKGRTVVILAEQFPSNVYAWRAKIEREGGDIVTVPRSTNGWTEAILDAIDSNTAVVSIPHCHWTDGTLVDLERVGVAARGVGAALVVDASQSFAAVPLDVKSVQPDFVVSVGYKWQLGYYGLGYLWVAEQHRGGVPLEEGWATRKNADDFTALVDYVDQYEPGARRFDVGERSNFVGVAMSNAATRQIAEWGVANVAETLGSTTSDIVRRVAELGWFAVPDDQRSGHLIGIRHPNGLPDGFADRLASAGVSLSVRGDSVRIAPYLHTTDDDIERLIQVLR